MRSFHVQGIEIRARRGRVFEFLKDPGNLPQWTHAFVSVEDGRARLETPAGTVDVGLKVSADAETGIVDWRLEFPDSTVGIAHSRVTETTRGTCIYTFVLHAPPVALEQVEGALEAQRVILESELATLKSLMERGREADDGRGWRKGGARGRPGCPRHARQGAARRCLRAGLADAVEPQRRRGRDAGDPGSNGHAALAIRFSQQAQDLGLQNRRQLHPRREEKSRRAHAD